jgi:glycosyltransferase involved in cell wall biosynthesis
MIEVEVITAQFSDSYFPIMDGVSLTISNYLAELNRTLGPAVAVVPAVPGCSDAQTSRTYRFVSLPLIGRPPYRIALPQLDLALQKALKARRFDLVHAHSPFLAGSFALRMARQRGIPIVATFHSKYRDKIENLVPRSPLMQSLLVDPLLQRIVDFYASADQVWVPTEAAGETLREYGYRGTVEIVRNGIDLDAPRDPAGLRSRAEEFLGLQRRDFLFLYVGDQAWEKNLAFLLRALSQVNGKGYCFKMVFVGEGYASRALRLLARKLGLSGNTIFTGVLRERAVLSACYARADCFLFPSLYDTCGLVVREAAAFAVPSVVINTSAAAEQIVDRFNGFVTDDSVHSYSDKLRWLLENPEALRRAGRGAQHTLCTSWKDVVQEVKARYLCLLRRSRSPMAGVHRSRTASRIPVEKEVVG